MSKRFTATEKWDRMWFRKLPNEYKLLWIYILDKCDAIGVWYVDMEQASFSIGTEVDDSRAIELFEKQVIVLSGGSKWYIKDFIPFQYGVLSANNNFHRSIINLLTKCEELSTACPQLINSLSTVSGAGEPSPRGTDKGKGKGKG